MTSPVRAPRVVFEGEVDGRLSRVVWRPSPELPGFDGFEVEVREQDAMGQPAWSHRGRILRDHGSSEERVIFAALRSLLKIE